MFKISLIYFSFWASISEIKDVKSIQAFHVH
jgi:hypothetical protein